MINETDAIIFNIRCARDKISEMEPERGMIWTEAIVNGTLHKWKCYRRGDNSFGDAKIAALKIIDELIDSFANPTDSSIPP